MTNILEFINNVITHKAFFVESRQQGKNRINNVGEGLERYIKEAFAGTYNINEERDKIKAFNEEFSWLGSQNNPPDIMIKGGDAIEVKKTESDSASLALNSSYPKSNLHSTSPMITSDCKNCENWRVKDLIYCIGHVKSKRLESLWVVYGNIYAADHQLYKNVINGIKDGIKEIPDTVFSETKELGRVNQVDPLGITNLRIRGMWQIENPRKVFNYLVKRNKTNFELVVIIPKRKFESFPKESITKINQIREEKFTIEDCDVKDPNNPANLIACKLITYRN